MRRHEFDPGVLVAGVLFLVLAVLYLGDAAGAWNVSTKVALLVIGVGLGVTGVTSGTAEAVRGRRRRRALSRK
jgi:hypothetical protein